MAEGRLGSGAVELRRVGSGGSRIPDENGNASELRERVEVASVVFVASDEPPEAQHSREEPFDVPPSAIAPQAATILGLGLSPRVCEARSSRHCSRSDRRQVRRCRRRGLR